MYNWMRILQYPRWSFIMMKFSKVVSNLVRRYLSSKNLSDKLSCSFYLEIAWILWLQTLVMQNRQESKRNSRVEKWVGLCYFTSNLILWLTNPQQLRRVGNASIKRPDANSKGRLFIQNDLRAIHIKWKTIDSEKRKSWRQKLLANKSKNLSLWFAMYKQWQMTLNLQKFWCKSLKKGKIIDIEILES